MKNKDAWQDDIWIIKKNKFNPLKKYWNSGKVKEYGNNSLKNFIMKKVYTVAFGGGIHYFIFCSNFVNSNLNIF